MQYSELIEEYVAGSQLIRQAVSGMTRDQLDATPIGGKWSTRQVVCHIADFELVNAERMKRVIVEDQPTLFGGDPDRFTAGLAYHQRDIEEELQLIEVAQRQMARILRTLSLKDFQRVGIHSEDGPMTLEALVRRTTSHVPHHIQFIEEKRRALLLDDDAFLEVCGSHAVALRSGSQHP